MRKGDGELPQKIAQLVESEQDQKTRALLMILQQVSISLIDNIDLIGSIAEEMKEHRKEFERHVEDEHARLNQGRGAAMLARIGLYFIGALFVTLQSIFGYFYLKDQDEIKRFQELTQQNTTEIVILKESLRR